MCTRNAIVIGLFLLLALPSALSSEPRLGGEVGKGEQEIATSKARYWLLAVKEGKIWAVTDYWLEDEILHYVLRDGTQASLPLSQVDVPFTHRLNWEREQEFRLPKPAAPKRRPLTQRETREPRQPGEVSTSPRAAPGAATLVQAPQAPARTSLIGVHKIYVEPMGGDLDKYITAEVTRQFKGKLSVVLHPEDADAILVGADRDYWGRMLLPASVSLLDANRKVVLWSWEVSKRGAWWDVWRPDRVAARIVDKLKRAISQAEKSK